MQWQSKAGTLAAFLATTGALASSGKAQVTIERVFLGNGGVVPNAVATGAGMSSDGRVVAFQTEASNLSAADNNGVVDIYVRDRVSGVTTLESIDAAGVVGQYRSDAPSLSADGHWLAFETWSGDLAPGAPFSNWHGLILRDRATGQNEWISVDINGSVRSGTRPQISDDGRFIAFMSIATNLVTGDTNDNQDVFVRDHVLGTTQRVSVSSSGEQAEGDCYQFGAGKCLSGDGRFIVFDTYSSNLVAGDDNSHYDVFLHDRANGQTRRVSLGSSGAQMNLDSFDASISADGSWVTFESLARQLVPNDTNLEPDVFIAHVASGAVERVSVGTNGLELNGISDLGLSSSDGRFAVFASFATNLGSVPSGYIHDRTTNVTLALNRTANGQPTSGVAVAHALSTGGHEVLVHCTVDLAGDGFGAGLFVIHGTYEVPITYCTAGTTSNACSASISAVGNPSASASSGFVLNVAQLEGQRSATIFYGLDNANYTPLAWGSSSSFLCVKAPTQRTQIQSSGGTSGACDGTLALDWSAFIALNPSALGIPLAAGQQVFAQAWLRDPASAKTSALSNALAFTVVP